MFDIRAYECLAQTVSMTTRSINSTVSIYVHVIASLKHIYFFPFIQLDSQLHTFTILRPTEIDLIIINHNLLTKMVHITFDITLPSQSIMDESFGKNLANIQGAPGTLQDIAYNILQERSNSTQSNDSGTKERTIFVLGSKGVVSDSHFHFACTLF